MATPAKSFTFADLQAMPDDNVIRAIVDGELYVSPPPVGRHQDAVLNIAIRLRSYAGSEGGKVYIAPYGVYYSETNFVEPDLIFIRADHLGRNTPVHMRGAPDLVIEVSSPSTRSVDLVVKRRLYETMGVPEFWFVDLEDDQVEVYKLTEGSFGEPSIKVAGEMLEPAGLPGLTVAVSEALAQDP